MARPVLSERTLHLKLYEKQWDDLERDEARALARNEKRNEPKRLDGYKVARTRQLIDMGRAYERLMKRKRRAEKAAEAGDLTNGFKCSS